MSAKLINIALDLETLSTQEDAAIIQIGCSIPFFDRKHVPLGISCDFEVTIAYEDCLAATAFHKCNDTMEWWEKQDPQTRKIVFSGQDSYITALDQLEFWLASIKPKDADIAIWGNGSDFDNRILSYTISAMGYKQMWNFRNNRDLRTLKALFTCEIGPATGEIKHTALGDARYEARLIHQIREVYMLGNL
jgi:hypothetical protein